MNREKSLNLILERIWLRPFNPVYEYKDILTNGHFAVFTSVVPDDIKKKFHTTVIYEEAEARRYENILNKVLEAKATFKDKSVVHFIPSGVLKNGDEGEEIVCMFYKKKMGEEPQVATYSQLYYEFITTVLGCDLYHDIGENHAYIVCGDTREVAGLLMPVVPSCCLIGD
ncbi:hypothetical protein Calkr_2146 [Caldicellulosiruptor acetigenus I77R1B]|uniref:Uncharacterized protein n=1 Tax=Caldicellulosiruptor acetigenus (strain ATCC 700853 / DSM 12137 / I77R1B) TaxID=632335 RepID=E4S5V1_CALA7|nr:hypothetical protein [Caldicellulosiruptor acetigenus]ADQ41611.1 hypothetical protein Calkr_2146 [Caldicellulosiruptor acetigenus I77R1B]